MIALYNFENSHILVGAYRPEKNQLEWILGETPSRPYRLYNVRRNSNLFANRAGNYQSLSVPDFIVLLNYKDIYHGAKVYKCLSSSEKTEADMQKLKYPNPNGSYIVFQIGAEIYIPDLDISKLVEIINKVSGGDFINSFSPVTISGDAFVTSVNASSRNAQYEIEEYYVKNMLQESGTFSIGINEDSSIITHYLQCKGTLYQDSYKEAAIKILGGDVEKKCILPEHPFHCAEHPRFSFIDLFAGMGGFRLAMEAQGGKCVFSSEWNPYAQKTYLANFGEVPFGDITLEKTKAFIPQQFDVLCAGFPCQPFSIAGVSKKKSLGRETGFKDKTQGTLFFDVADIINRHRPKAFYLENVKNLTSHDKGNTFRVIRETLEELEYSIYYQVMDAQTYVPQHRERIMIVGFDKRIFGGKEQFTFPPQKSATSKVKDILDSNVDPKYTLSDKLWIYLQNYAEKHKAKGNGFGYGLVNLEGITRTLSARYYKDGSEILIPQNGGLNPRRLSPRECARLMGYPDKYILNAVSDVQAYRQCGNSVVVPLITAVSEQIIKSLQIP